MKATLDLLNSAIELDGRTCVCAAKTPREWRWFSNVGRVGTRMDFQTKEKALRAAAKTMGITITEVIPDSQEQQA